MNLSTHPHLRLLREAAGEYVRDRANYFAGAMVYYALLSLVPLLVLAMAALGWLLRLSPLAADLGNEILTTVEVSFGADVRTAVQAGLLQLQEGSTLATLIGFVGLLMTSSALFAHLRMTFRAVWKQPPPLAAGSLLHAFLAKLIERLIAFGIMFGGGAILLVTIAVVATIHWLASLPGELSVLGDTLGHLLPLMGSLVVAPLTFALLLRVLPPTRLAWRDLKVAAVLCGLAWILGAEVLTIYAARTASRWSAYGAIGGILIVMLWMQAMSKMLFFGAELSKVTHRARTNKDRTPPGSHGHPSRAPGTVAAAPGSSVG